MIRTERTKARERKKYDAIELGLLHRRRDRARSRRSTPARGRAAPSRAGGRTSPRATTVGPMVKGPLTVTDIVCWHVGMGMGLYGVKPLRLGARNRRRVPRFFHRDDQNVPDVMQRVHWDPEFARRSGNPTTFDYGRMRETWLIHLCTDWMGDDAWLWKLDCEFRLFNYVGDTQWLRGTVARKYLADGDRPAVDLDLERRQPAWRGHHAGPRHHPAAEPRARPGAPARPARRRDRPAAGARRHRRRVRRRSRGCRPMSDYAVRRRARRRARRRRSCGSSSTGPAKRNAIDDAMMSRPDRRRSTRAGRDEAVRVIVLDRRGRPLLRRRRHRRPQRQPGR